MLAAATGAFSGDGVGGFGPPQAASSMTAAIRTTGFDIIRMATSTLSVSARAAAPGDCDLRESYSFWTFSE